MLIIFVHDVLERDGGVDRVSNGLGNFGPPRNERYAITGFAI